MPCVMRSPTRETHINSDMCSPTQKHTINYLTGDMCSSPWETDFLSDNYVMCFSGRETYSPSDMCSPTLLTHTFSDISPPTWETHITRDMGFSQNVFP